MAKSGKVKTTKVTVKRVVKKAPKAPKTPGTMHVGKEAPIVPLKKGPGPTAPTKESVPKEPKEIGRVLPPVK